MRQIAILRNGQLFANVPCPKVNPNLNLPNVTQLPKLVYNRIFDFVTKRSAQDQTMCDGNLWEWHWKNS